MDNRPIVVSFSGGKSSAMMCDLLETLPEYRNRKKYYVFANTGREMHETLDFVRRWEMWLNVKITRIEAVIHLGERKSSTYKIVRQGEMSTSDKPDRWQPYWQMVEKYGLPSVGYPHCTRELKINPIKAYIKDHLGLKTGEYVQAVGMRFDESERIKKDKNYIYPLYDKGITKRDVLDFFQNEVPENWRLKIEDYEGNCDFCFKKSWAKLTKMAEKHPSRLLFWSNLENAFWEEDTNLFRGHRMALDLILGLNLQDEDLSCACGHNEDASF